MVHDYPQNLVPPFLLHQVPKDFPPTGDPDLVHNYPQTLVPPFPVHQVPVSFRPTAGPDLVHDNPQNLVPPFLLHQVPVSFRPASQISPGPPSDERRKAMRKAHRPSLIAFLHLNSKAKRAEQRTGLRSALHIIIPKGKVMRGGPRALLLIISKKRIDDERPHRSPFVVNSYHLLPGRPLLARSLSALSTGPNPHAMRREKVANYFLTTFATTFLTTFTTT